MSTIDTLTQPSDSELIQASLAGDRAAFGKIVGRYQSLVCALAYSATGSRSHSEDIAQETFVTAWTKLRDLREPSRLSAWLCGIARHIAQGDRRRLGRQPAHAAHPLDTADPLASPEPSPTAQAVTNEEMAILWREVGRLPEIYREPLILYYRDHQSAEHVAAALDVTPDAVLQRLTRGRRLLQERMLEFIESTLFRTNPDARFGLHVLAALPLLAGAGPAVATGVAQGSAAAKGGTFGVLLTWLAPLVGVLAALGISWSEVAHAPSARERRFAARWVTVLWLSTAGFVAALFATSSLAHSAGLHQRQDWLATAPVVAVWFGFAMVCLTLIILLFRGKAALRRQMIAEGLAPAAPEPPSMRKRMGVTAAFLVSLFWILIFLAWHAGDRAGALAISAGVIALGAAPLWLSRRVRSAVQEQKAGCRFVALCGLVFLAILNVRLDAWLAPLYGVDLPTMHRLLPMAMIHAASVIAVAWTAALVFVTRPEPKPE